MWSLRRPLLLTGSPLPGATKRPGAHAGAPFEIGHLALGSVNSVAGSLPVGSIPGTIIGSRLTSRILEQVLSPNLAGTRAVAGAKLVV